MTVLAFEVDGAVFHDTMTDARSWKDRAACIGLTDMFFPSFERGQSNRSCSYSPALAVCARCPVQDECREDAFARNDTDFGVVGGMTPGERRREAKRRRGLTTRQNCCAWCALIFQGRLNQLYCSSSCQYQHKQHRARQARA